MFVKCMNHNNKNVSVGFNRLKKKHEYYFTNIGLKRLSTFRFVY